MLEKNIKIAFKNIQKYTKDFFSSEKSVLPFVIIILMTGLLFYNNSIIIKTQKTAYEPYKIANELRNSSENLTKYANERTYTELKRYYVLNYIYMFTTFLVVCLLFIRFRFFIDKIEKQINREKVIRKIIDTMRSSIDINSVRNEVVKEIGKFLKADRVFFADYDFVSNNFSVAKDSEYKSSEKIKSFAGNEMAITEGLVEAMKKFPLNDKDLIFGDLDKYLEENNLTETTTGKIFRDMGCIATIGIHINYGEFFYGDIVVTSETKQKISKDDVTFVRALADQAGIAIYQSKVFEKEKEMFERENLLRKIFETMRSSLELHTIKSTIVNEVSKALNANRCCLINYNKNNDVFIIEKYAEYRSSTEVKSLIGKNLNDPKFDKLIDLYKMNKEIIFSNVRHFIETNNLEGTPVEQYFNEYDIKAIYSIPIFNADEMLGVLSVQYTKDYQTLRQEDIDFLRMVAVQAGEAIYQAELYKTMQFQAERERINRSIVEILRSSMDKPIIKKLFVKNIGKFFDADRVFFCDYDTSTKTFLPVNEKSEYLSNDNQKSFIDFNWSATGLNEYINPLLEKREIKITNFDEYIKANPDINNKLIARYTDFAVKSSYSFPVLYQNDIMGYFCIEFTRKNRILSDEDIGRIRSICTQAGIGLYHAELYLRSKQYELINGSTTLKILEQITKPVNKILDLSMSLSKNELERKIQIEYLDTIIFSCNQLLKLTNDI